MREREMALANPMRVVWWLRRAAKIKKSMSTCLKGTIKTLFVKEGVEINDTEVTEEVVVKVAR